jgi:hypothetical protein
MIPSWVPAAVKVGEFIRVGDAEGESDEVALASSALASPKSSTLTLPSAVSLMLAGLRSRCTMPFSCAASSASAICRAIASVSSTGMAPCAMRSCSVGPSTNSSTNALAPSESSTPWIVAMCG